MSRRVERIYPAFAAVFAVYLVLTFLFPQESKIPSPWPHGLLYVVQNVLLLPGIVPIDR
jgi:peptidoglycan/LPS O-acetylase OafA/YrhL